MNSEQITKDYLTNKITYDEFMENFDEMKEFLELRFKDAKVRQSFEPYENDDETISEAVATVLNIKDVLFRKSAMYSLIYTIMVNTNYAYIPYDNIYKMRAFFCLDNIPQFLYSDETAAIFEKELIPFLPTNGSRGDIKKFINNKCHELFNFKLFKKPKWLQEGEWPVRNGKPCLYESSENIDYIGRTYNFKDATNDEIIVIEQFY